MEQLHPLQGALWIGADAISASPRITRHFRVHKPRSARLIITGLGYFTAEINGQNVTDHRFQPVVSEYGPRDLSRFSYPLFDQLTYRIYYCTYDVSDLITEDDNRLDIRLGNGFYRQTERASEGPMAYSDTLKTIYSLVLTYPDREIRICSDGSETWQETEIVYNNLYIGEVHDYSRTLPDPRPVRVLPEETAMLCPQIGIPDRPIRTLCPTLISEKDGVRIYDAGENISGVVRLTAPGRKSEKIKLQFAEVLSEDGALSFHSSGGSCVCTTGRRQIQEDVCICGCESRTFEPLFVWHAFRYFSLEGPGSDPVVQVIHADTAPAAEFDSDSEALNFLYDAFLRTQKNNMHGSIPSDCPHRERLGYTGDGQVAAAAVMMTLDTREFFKKWMQDILDTQDTLSGHVQHTAPLGGGGGGPVGWGGAIVVVPYRYFKQYGDTELLRRSWEPILKWIAYIRTRMDGGLITREEPRGWCLGDWAALDPITIPEPLVNTCLFIRYLDMLAETAPLLNRQRDIPLLRQLQQQCRDAVTAAYFDVSTGQFCGGVQGADAYGLYAGLGDDRTVQHLMRRYQELNFFDTGFIGTDVLLEVLLEHGGTELVFRLLTSEQKGSFLYMKRQGATTIWEHWDGRESHNHPMFGGCVRHLFEGFLGIRQACGTGGYSDVTVQPRIPEGLGYVSGSLQTPRGEIRVSARRENGKIRTDIHLP